MYFFIIIFSVVAMYVLTALVLENEWFSSVKEVKEKAKEGIVVEKDFKVASVIKTNLPLLKEIKLYDFDRDSSGKLLETGELYLVYLLTLLGKDEAEGGWLEIDQDEEGQFYVGLKMPTDTSYLDLMAMSTNVAFNAFFFKKLNETLLDKMKETDVTKKVEDHVSKLLTEVFMNYVEKLSEMTDIEVVE